VTLTAGSLTALLTTAAASAAAGAILGGVAAGMLEIVASWESDDLERRVRKAGSWGGAIGLLILGIDQIAR
jgi:hypothetical protein